jgi:hypothetical protein
MKRVWKSLVYGVESTDWDNELIRQDRRYIQPACWALIALGVIFALIALINTCQVQVHV